MPSTPRFEDIFAVLAAASRGDTAARVGSAEPDADDTASRLAVAVNRLLDDLSRRIGEERKLIAALRVSEERYRLLFESNPIPMWVFDAETLGFLAVNEAATRHYGYERDEFARMTIKDIRPPEDLPALLADVVDPPRISDVSTWRHRKKDGTIITVDITAHAFTFGGRPARLVLAHDVTTRQSLEEQLRHAQKMEAVGQLAGGIAHDFNNLLSVILSYGRMLVSDVPTGEPMRDDLEEIVRAGERGAALSRQLLTFSRQQVFETTPLDLGQVVADMEKMLRRVIGEHIELSTTTGAALGSVRADRGQIEQALMNLVVNARDAMPDGGKLVIETANVELSPDYAREHLGVAPGPYVMMSVSDTGIGMDRATRARIFEPFFSTKEKAKGTGLGLSVVFGIVKQSRGNIWVYSEPGRGTVFKVYLPRVQEAAALQPAGADVASGSLSGSETILLVEDEEQVRLLARGLLRKRGYHVLEAPDGGEALRLSEQHPGTIHLLLTDVVMPHVSGPELSRRLVARRPDMKVLCMSGYTDGMVLDSGLVDSGMAFLQKPITPEALWRRVREVLDAA